MWCNFNLFLHLNFIVFSYFSRKTCTLTATNQHLMQSQQPFHWSHYNFWLPSSYFSQVENVTLAIYFLLSFCYVRVKLCLDSDRTYKASPKLLVFLCVVGFLGWNNLFQYGFFCKSIETRFIGTTWLKDVTTNSWAPGVVFFGRTRSLIDS